MIEGQQTLLGRTMHSIDYDDLHDEIVVPQPLSQAVMTFRGGANGEEPPIRVIQGPLTQLVYPTMLTLDPVHNEIFVPVYGGDAILVFPREATGNVAPIRVLKGLERVPSARQMTIDPVHNLLLVRGRPATGADDGRPRMFGRQRGEREDGSVVIFERTAQGDAKPLGVLNTGRGHIFVNPPREAIIVVGNVGEGLGVSVWSLHDRGDAPPRRRWMLQGPDEMLSPLDSAMAAGLNPKNKTLVIGNKTFNAVLTYAFPELF
jgi:hypothetical protein